jgi:hypothetical protein
MGSKTRVTNMKPARHFDNATMEQVYCGDATAVSQIDYDYGRD